MMRRMIHALTFAALGSGAAWLYYHCLILKPADPRHLWICASAMAMLGLLFGHVVFDCFCTRIR